MMTTINAFLAAKGIYMLTLLLLALGVAGVIVCNNYMKKLICMNVMQVAVIFFFLSLFIFLFSKKIISVITIYHDPTDGILIIILTEH